MLKPYKGQKYEYKVIQMNDQDLQQINKDTKSTMFQDILNQFGKKGWKYIDDIAPNPMDNYVVLMRPLN